jgi:hypothetical protein
LRQRRGKSNADRDSEKTPDQVGSGVGSCLTNVFNSRVHDHASYENLRTIEPQRSLMPLLLS